MILNVFRPEHIDPRQHCEIKQTWDAAELLRNSGYDSWSDVNTWKSIRTHHVYTYCLCTNNYAPCCLIIHVQTCRDRHIHMHLISAVQYSFSAHCCIIIISYTFYFLITTLCTFSVVESEWTCAAGVTLNLLMWTESLIFLPVCTNSPDLHLSVSNELVGLILCESLRLCQECVERFPAADLIVTALTSCFDSKIWPEVHLQFLFCWLIQSNVFCLSFTPTDRRCSSTCRCAQVRMVDGTSFTDFC